MATKEASAPLKDERMRNEMLKDQFAKEIQQMKNFGSTWGEVCKGEAPKSLDEAINMKRRELEALQTKVGGTGKAMAMAYSTATNIYSECAEKPDPEAGLKKGYRVLRAGI